MKDLILWLVVALTHFTYTFPPLLESRTTPALVVKLVLGALLGFCVGMGIADALQEILP